MLNSPDLITRLAGQALDRAVPETWTTLSLTQLQRFQQAFAELIVAECISKIESYEIPVGNSAAGEMACEWTYDALKEIRAEIRELFEVDE